MIRRGNSGTLGRWESTNRFRSQTLLLIMPKLDPAFVKDAVNATKEAIQLMKSVVSAFGEDGGAEEEIDYSLDSIYAVDHEPEERVSEGKDMDIDRRLCELVLEHGYQSWTAIGLEMDRHFRLDRPFKGVSLKRLFDSITKDSNKSLVHKTLLDKIELEYGRLPAPKIGK